MRRTRVLVAIALIVILTAVGALVLLQRHGPTRVAADVLAASGPPLAVATSAELGRLDRGILHNEQVRLFGLRPYSGNVDDRQRVVWVYSDDSQVQLHVESVFTGIFADVSGRMPFAFPSSFRVRLIKLDEHGQVIEDKTPSAYSLLLERGGQ